MRKGIVAPMLLAGLWAGAAGAQSVLDFDVWMQKIDLHSQRILLNLKRQDAAASVADAQALERLYRQMEQFYEQRGDADDAVIASYDGRERAAAVVAQVGKGDYDNAFESAAGIARDCRNCHDRFKPIKPLR